jgi:hypothetical protein
VEGNVADYQVAIGWDEIGNLTDIVPQPARVDPLQHGQINFTAHGLTYPNGYINGKLSWNAGLERSDYTSIMTQFGLSLNQTSELVTIRFIDDYENVVYANCVASYRQDARRGMVFWSGLDIYLNRVEFISS